MKKILIITLLVAAATSSFAQEQCLFDQLHAEQLQNPEYRDGLKGVESRSSFMGVVTIPVVVHIMTPSGIALESFDVSDEQVYSAIQALNDDFRDTESTGGVDTEIEFCLASRSPEGFPTNGIIRVNAGDVPDYNEEGIGAGGILAGASEVNVKALSIWPRDEYVNIWVVNKIANSNNCTGIQGYAYFPASSIARDGIVMDDGAFGTVGSVCGNLSDGSILSHEMGHVFYLYHSFQGGCNETDCETQGDRVCDTPPASQIYNCIPSCNGVGNPNLYMSYTSCKTQFSQGQSDRMRAVLEQYRSGLITSLGCSDPEISCLGDINLDGVVDIQDFTELNSAYGSNCTGCLEDLNGDGIVEIQDFLILNGEFGNICVTSPSQDVNTNKTVNRSGYDIIGRKK